jgi:hypothetical protein
MDSTRGDRYFAKWRNCYLLYQQVATVKEAIDLLPDVTDKCTKALPTLLNNTTFMAQLAAAAFLYQQICATYTVYSAAHPDVAAMMPIYAQLEQALTRLADPTIPFSVDGGLLPDISHEQHRQWRQGKKGASCIRSPFAVALDIIKKPPPGFDAIVRACAALMLVRHQKNTKAEVSAPLRHTNILAQSTSGSNFMESSHGVAKSLLARKSLGVDGQRLSGLTMAVKNHTSDWLARLHTRGYNLLSSPVIQKRARLRMKGSRLSKVRLRVPGQGTGCGGRRNQEGRLIQEASRHQSPHPHLHACPPQRCHHCRGETAADDGQGPQPVPACRTENRHSQVHHQCRPACPR